MNDATAPDADDLIQVTEGTLKFIRSQNWSKQRPVEVLEELFSKTNEYLNNGINIEDCQFTAADIAGFIDASKQDDSEAARRWLTPHLNALQDYLIENQARLDTELRAKGIRQRLKLSKTESKGGHKNHYYLDLESISASQETSEANPNTPLDSEEIPIVRYQVKQLPKPSFWLKPFLKINLTGWKRYAYALLPVSLLLVAFLMLEYALIGKSPSMVAYLLWYTVVMWILWLAFGAFYVLIDKGIAKAPSWMTPISIMSAQLEMIPLTDRKLSGSPFRSIRLVRYGASCPICEAPININVGRGEFKGRLIGQCMESGAEHIFSFDHITKKGVPLRSNAYYGRSERLLGKFYSKEPQDGE